MKPANFCVLIPTYNNAAMLAGTLEGALAITKDVIVVNDGSTDTTAEVLQNYPGLTLISSPDNRGKGHALKAGFKKAYGLGYEYAITIDSDGQHFPGDIDIFLRTLRESQTKNLLLVGSRDLKGSGAPGKSRFGKAFSNFWFWVETGIRLRDTQSGFRLYPLKPIDELRLRTSKFEFEIEVLVKAAWAGTTVESVPIRTQYDRDSRVSHFRPFRDFVRISVLNTWLVFLAFFYIKPRNLFRQIRKRGFRKFLLEDILGHNDPPAKKALSVALGVVIGLSPLWGFHTVIALFLAIAFRLNRAISFAFSNVSLPPFIPFIVYAGFQTGALFTGTEHTFQIRGLKDATNWQVTPYLITYLIGSVVFAVVMAILAGVISYALLLARSQKVKK